VSIQAQNYVWIEFYSKKSEPGTKPRKPEKVQFKCHFEGFISI